MPAEKLRRFLDENGVRYVTISHSRAYTTQEVAAAARIPGKEMAKAVIVKIDGEVAMAVLPGSYMIDFDRFREVTGAATIELASEEEFKGLFPDCETGAMPPFGHLYGLKTFMADTLADDEEIAFNAGSHSELIKMSFADFLRLEEPIELQFALEPA